MNEDHQWETLSRRLFPSKEEKAPAFLWTRILAAIESREAELVTWWGQWRWMSRMATALTLVAGLAIGVVFFEDSQAVPLENLLQGSTATSESSLASMSPAKSEEITTAWLVEGDKSWAEN